MENKPGDKIIPINLAVFVAYLILSFIPNGLKNPSGAVMLFPAHIAVCFIIGLVCVFSERYRKLAPKWFLSALIVLLIGFSTCCLVLMGS